MSDEAIVIRPDVEFHTNVDLSLVEVYVNGKHIGPADSMRQAWLIAGTAFFKAEALRCRKAFLNNEGPS